MFKTKYLAGFLLIAAILFSQTGTVLAAPLAQDTTPIIGTILSITTETDALGTTTVVVTLVDETEVEQTLRLSVDDANALGLVTLDSDTMEPLVDEAQISMPVEIDPMIVIPEDLSTKEPEESHHIISTILSAFFDVDAGTIDTYHEDGYGFGVIAQALWMSQNYSGDASLTEGILQAKTDKDYETFFEEHPEYLTEGEAIPSNWGQFKKLVSEKKDNLGSVVSGKAEKNKGEDDTTVEQSQPGNGNEKNNDKSNNGKGKDKSKDKDKGKN